MVSSGMKRYRQRTDDQARLIGDAATTPLNTAELFGRSAPVRLEVGFGHGRFLSQMAEVHPEVDFIGVEQQDLRVTKTAHQSNKRGAQNVRLYWDDAHRFVRERLSPGSLERAYVLFSDPWPKPRHRRRRLMNRSFLLDMAWALQPGGRLIIASDTHNYALQALTNCSTLPGMWRNCYQPQGYRINIPTRFPTVFEQHKKAEGCSICYLMLERTKHEPLPRAAYPGLNGGSPLRRGDHARGNAT
ncbi:MAG: tRNA (guanosine(46)-N7)-methyltransferase TrmB [Planctomycetota bacterium]|jgi:tRNA (guanine-N7-)-methyltransferase|nr:tRNA (guanosine(46)-N7)-methyltransferase TrmB [Planctomycetota bacterium]